MSNSVPSPQGHVVFTEFEGDEGVLVDLNSKRYYTLNETATLIWRALEKGLSKDEMARQLTEAYDVTPERAAASIESLLASLQSHHLLR
ncbi:MAG: PqqD family protein [Acidobacteria bacterium]|nr:PqqD family protein [Acidobacteriota bacterium]